MNKKRKVVYLTYIPSPYKVDFFNELSKFSDLLVVYYNKNLSNLGWKNDDKAHFFKYEVLFNKSKILGLLKLIRILRNNKNEIFVVGGYSKLP